MEPSRYARRYVEKFGFHLVPLKEGEKLPIANDWGNETLAAPDEAEAFYAQSPHLNMGFALGPSGYCSLDIDCEESFRSALEEFGIPPESLDDYPCIQGSPKGRRLVFRVPAEADLPYAKLNWPKREGGTQYTVFELRSATDGRQRFDVLPPSIHPDTQQPYKWLVQPAASRVEWPEPPSWLMSIWEAWDRFKPQFKDACPWAEKPPEPAPPKPKRQDGAGGNVIEEYLSRNPLDEELLRHGYKRIGRRFLSPHSGTGLPGVTVPPSGTSCWIHHASDPLCSEESGRPVNAFDLFCEYDHGGDVSKAVKAIAEEYGMERPARKQTPAAKALTAEPEPPVAPEFGEPVAPEPEAKASPSRPFKALGYDGDHYFYLPRGTEQVKSIRAGSHTSPAEMLTLAPLEWWDMAFPKEKGGCDWQQAASTCMRMCEDRGPYSTAIVRGRGSWYDDGRAILHLGDRLIVDGEPTTIIDHKSRYIYTRNGAMESTISPEPATDAEAKQVFDMIARVNWGKPVHGWLASGWVALAPICGALKWRPHIWITAQRGAGKSWVQDNIFRPLLGQTAMIVQGGTTEAGIRQHIKQDARPILFDEAEAENTAGQRRMQSVIELARQSSSDNNAEIIKGTAAGGGVAFRMRSMFMLGSVNVALTQAADESRFTVLPMKTPDKTVKEIERFAEFEKDVGNLLTSDFCASIRARMYRLMPVIRKNSHTMSRAVAEELGSQRIGDQIGTLLAGAIALSRGDEIDPDEARKWVRHIDFSEAREVEESSDEESCINAMLQQQVRFDSTGGVYTRMLSELVQSAWGKVPIGALPATETNEVLMRYGLRVDGSMLYISNTHAELKKLLKDTPWAAGWRRVIGRIPGAEAPPSPIRFGGSKTRAIGIPISFFD